MKKNYLYIGILLIIASIALYYYYSDRSGTLSEELTNFSIADTSAVNKIFLADKSGKQITLERMDEGWEINRKYNARKDAVDLLLKTLLRMEVKSPVSKSSFENVVKNLASDHVKVEVYTESETPEKTFFVGGPTQDNYGTYMMLEKSSTPFIMHIPGFNGYLSTRFFTNENDWRAINLFKYDFDEIQSVKVYSTENPMESFQVSNLGNNKFEVSELSTGKVANDFNLVKAKQYLGLYKNLSFERFVSELQPHSVDSIINSKEIYKIELKDTYDQITTVRAFLRPAEAPTEEDPWDIDRMYAQINDSKDLVIIQYYSFDPLFLNFKYFLN